MWNTSGFLAKVFSPFSTFGISVDLITTSTYSVSLTLDHIPGGVKGLVFQKLLRALSALGEVKIVHPVSVVSIVGRQLRSALAQLGDAMSLLDDKKTLLVSQSAEDLSMSFVLPQDEVNVDDIVSLLHDNIFNPKVDNLGVIFGSRYEKLESRINTK